MDGWVWSNGGMVLTGETEMLGEKHYTAWVIDGWMSMEQWWNGTDRERPMCWGNIYKPVSAPLWSLQQSVCSIASILSRTDQKAPSHCSVYSKISQTRRQLRPELFAAFRSFNVPAAHITDNTTTQLPADYTQSPLSVVGQAVHRWHCYPPLQVTEGVLSSSPILWDAVKKGNIQDHKKWILKRVHVSVGTPRFFHTRTRHVDS